MAEYVGRDAVLRLNGSIVMCFRTLGMNVNGEPIDISDGCSNGYRELSRTTGQKSIDLAVEGIAKTSFLRSLVLSGDSLYLDDAVLEFPPIEGGSEGASISMDVVLADYAENLTADDVTTFSTNLQSSGAWTFTPEA
jgi:predicted secreted protein